MKQLNDLVLETVQNFVRNGVLFTALDVSNAVKHTMPFARHREVRDLVRSLFTSEIESSGYARTPISVTLSNGSKADALLYHPLADSWDLDAKYSSQKRGQAPAPVVAAPVAPVVIVPPPPPPTNRDLWNNLFKSQTSLFPSK